MADSWMDRLPTTEQQKLRRRLRSPEAYEALREKVKGPEDLADELKRNEALADLALGMETQPQMREQTKAAIERGIAEKGIEALLAEPNVSDAVRNALEAGRFTVGIREGGEKDDDRLAVIPEGHVQEKIPLKTSMSEKYSMQLAMQAKTRDLSIVVNGKLSAHVTVPIELYEDDMVALAVRHPVVSKALKGRAISEYAYQSGGVLYLRTA